MVREVAPATASPRGRKTRGELFRSRILPRAYWDARALDFEVRHLLDRRWHLVCHESLVAKPGDFVALDVGPAPVVVVRETADRLHAFRNCCLHRKFPIASGRGNARRLQCPFHAWTYRLDGRLHSAPGALQSSVEGHGLGLRPAALEVHGGYVWVSFDPDARPFAEDCPEFLDFVASGDLALDDYEFFGTVVSPIACNWKSWMENASDCYHCSAIHPSSFCHLWQVSEMEFTNEGLVMAQLGDPNRRTAAERDPDERFRSLLIFPNSFVQVDGVVAFVGMIVPTGPATSSIWSHVYVNRAHGPGAFMERLRLYKQTGEEDHGALERQAAALPGAGTERSWLVRGTDDPVAHFQALLVQAYRESDEGAAWYSEAA